MPLSNKPFQSHQYRERSQPSSRNSLGLLEKKRDYVERAKDYHRKDATIKSLRQKARLRNPDEFYFKMISTSSQNGIHKAGSELPALSEDQERLAKTQDLNYVRQRIQRDQNRCDRIVNLLTCASTPSNVQRTVFVDTEDVDEDACSNVIQESKVENCTLKPQQELIDEMKARKDRLQKLKQVEQKMKLVHDLSKKDRKVLVKKNENGVPIYKWKQERKK